MRSLDIKGHQKTSKDITAGHGATVELAAAEARDAIACSGGKLTIHLMRKLVSQIEESLAHGMSHTEIHSRLQQQGFKATFRYYRLMLYRVRKENARDATAPSGAVPPALLMAVPSETKLEEAPRRASDDPPRHEVTWDVKAPIIW